MAMIIHCDGLAQPNPGQGTWAFVVFEDERLLRTLAEHYGYLGASITNNVAEYTAVVKALEWVQGQTKQPVTVLTDSMLVVNTINRKWKCKKPHLIGLRNRGVELMIKLPNVTLGWISGDDNEADEWTRIAYFEALGVPAEPRKSKT